MSAEFLKMHQNFRNCSIKNLQIMTQKGINSPIFKKIMMPIYSACMYARATRKAWKSKTLKYRTQKQERTPGECVSVDQLVLPTP